MPRVFLELVLLQDVLDAIGKHMSGDRITSWTLELLTGGLSSQYDRFEASWKEAMRSRTGDIYFQESCDLFHTAFEAVDGAYEDIASAGAKLKATAVAEQATAEAEAKAAAVPKGTSCKSSC